MNLKYQINHRPISNKTYDKYIFLSLQTHIILTRFKLINKSIKISIRI